MKRYVELLSMNPGVILVETDNSVASLWLKTTTPRYVFATEGLDLGTSYDATLKLKTCNKSRYSSQIVIGWLPAVSHYLVVAWLFDCAQSTGGNLRRLDNEGEHSISESELLYLLDPRGVCRGTCDLETLASYMDTGMLQTTEAERDTINKAITIANCISRNVVAVAFPDLVERFREIIFELHRMRLCPYAPLRSWFCEQLESCCESAALALQNDISEQITPNEPWESASTSDGQSTSEEDSEQNGQA